MVSSPAPFARHIRFEGVFLRPVVTDSPRLASVEVFIVPDHVIEEHIHEGSDEHFFFIEGSGMIFDGTTWQSVTSSDAVTIPAGTTHAVRCVGRVPLHYVATYSPPLS